MPFDNISSDSSTFGDGTSGRDACFSYFVGELPDSIGESVPL